MKRLFVNAGILAWKDETFYYIEDGCLAVDGDTISYIGKERPAGEFDDVRDMSGKLLMPGLINCHCHNAMVLLRGTGSRGLAGIPAVRDNIARPLLGVTRTEISAYAARHGIAHVTDECNLDPEEATRNLLRQKVLPLLVGVNPRAVENINRAAGIVGRENDTLDALAEELIARGEACGDGFSISCDTLRAAPAALAERAVLLLLGRVGGARRDLGAAHVDAVLRLAAGHGRAQLDLPYEVEVSRRNGKLFFVRATQKTLTELPLRLGETVLFGDYELCAAEGCEGDIILRAEDAEKFTVGPWRSGEGMNLTQGRGKRSGAFRGG